MQTVQGNALQSLRNVAAFLDKHADKLEGVVQTGVRQRLDDAIVDLQAYVTSQSDSAYGSKGATQKHRALRRALIRDHMKPIARIAAADLPDTPELQPLKLPAGRPSAQRLAASAYGMAETAARYSDTFIKAALPADFAAQLTSAADRMIESIGERAENRLVRRSATKGLKTRLAAGRKVVRVLDALVQSKLQDDPALLAGWDGAKRVEQVSGGRPASAPVTPATPAASAAPKGVTTSTTSTHVA
jgi:hypothetical protein